MSRFLSVTRYVALIPVLAALVVAVALLLYGAVEGVRLVLDLVNPAAAGKATKMVAVSAIKVVDVLLLGIVLQIIALGLYELFVDENLVVPDWLEIHSLDDLKHKLISGLIVVLVVFFVEQVAAWDGQRELFSIGASIALVIASLAFYLSQKPFAGQKLKKGEPGDQA